MKKTLLYFGLASLAFFNFSCDSDKEEVAVPKVELTMERTFVYHDTHETKKANYTTADFNTGIKLENDQLTIYLAAEPDEVAFEVKKADLLNGYVGVYSLKTLPNPETGKANTTYIYDNNDGSGSAFFSQGNFIGGELKITEYNKQHNLISGTYNLTMQDVPDPMLKAPTSNPRRCDVTVTGTFKNGVLITNP